MCNLAGMFQNHMLLATVREDNMKLNDVSLFKQACYVNGEWVTSEATLTVTNPYDGSTIGTVPKFGRSETEKTIAAAHAAWPAWRAKTAKERCVILHKWHDLIVANIDDLATILSTEQGKPLAESRGEILNGCSYIDWFAEECRRAYGEIIPSPWPGKQPIATRQSVGVAAAITPWNFPSSMITRKAAPALAAGCPVVLKPATATPYSAFALAVLAERAGFPAGVFSVITGDSAAIGSTFASSHAVRALSFTGSTAVGKQLMSECAQTVKKLGLELGGNAPYLVFDDADIDHAVESTMGCKFRNAGQTCICANRILVQKGVYEQYAEKLVRKVQGMVLGNGLEQGVTQGPMIDAKSVANLEALVADAVAKGAKVLCGGKRTGKLGNFFEPTVLGGVTPDMRVFKEEIFGPVAPLVSFATEDEAIAMANDTEFGLASYVFARDIGRIWRVSQALEYGLVGVNDVALASGELPFGGVKESGLGREGGRAGLEEFLEIKYTLLGRLDV